MKNLFILIIAISFCFKLQAQETIVIDENFDNNGRGWLETKKSNYEMLFEDGYYVIKNKYDGTAWNIQDIDLDANKDDFSIEATVSASKEASIKPTSEESGKKLTLKEKLLAAKNKVAEKVGKKGKQVYGLVWGIYADKSDYHRFLINSEGKFYLDNYYNKEAHDYALWIESSAINKDGTNVLKVLRTSNIVTFYINGQEVFKKGGNSYFGSKIGFYAQDKSTLYADRIVVKKFPPNIPTVANLNLSIQKEKLSDMVNTEYGEVGGVISPDGNSLYIGRKYDPRNTGYSVRDKDIDIWLSELDLNGNWTLAKNMGFPVNNNGYNWVISVSPDNNTLLLSNTYESDGSSGSQGVSITNRTRTGWSIPTALNIDNYYNSSDYVDYCLGPNNKVLLMAVERGDTNGDRDLYASFLRDNGTWTEPKNLGNTVNSFSTEESPFIASDNKTLFFGSDGHLGHGSNDIFISRRLDESWTNWSEPLNLGSAINSNDYEASFLLAAKGDYAYFVSDNDIYKIKTAEEAKPDPVVLVSGTVYNSKTKEKLTAGIRYFDLFENIELGTAISSPTDGSYKIALPAGKLYSFLADKQNFYAISENIDLRELENYTELKKDLYLSPIEKGEVIRLNSVFFETNKDELKKESFNELDRLYDILIKSPALKIEIAGHTDDVGSVEYNQKLSNDRAISVQSYLISKGMDAGRLKARGYGELQPVVPNDTDENRAYNRRVEFRVLEN